jgi:hypothetical protein
MLNFDRLEDVSVEHRVLFNKKYERSKFRQAHYVH